MDTHIWTQLKHPSTSAISNIINDPCHCYVTLNANFLWSLAQKRVTLGLGLSYNTKMSSADAYSSTSSVSDFVTFPRYFTDGNKDPCLNCRGNYCLKLTLGQLIIACSCISSHESFQTHIYGIKRVPDIFFLQHNPM